MKKQEKPKYVTKFKKRSVLNYCSLALVVGAHQYKYYDKIPREPMPRYSDRWYLWYDTYRRSQWNSAHRKIYDYKLFTDEVKKAFRHTSKHIVLTNFSAIKKDVKAGLLKCGWKHIDTHKGNDVRKVNVYALHLRNDNGMGW